MRSNGFTAEGWKTLSKAFNSVEEGQTPMTEISVRPLPVGRYVIFQKEGTWWLRQWHELLPNMECGPMLTQFSSAEKAEEQAEALDRSGKYVRVNGQ
jgi:hypothetical protein